MENQDINDDKKSPERTSLPEEKSYTVVELGDSGNIKKYASCDNLNNNQRPSEIKSLIARSSSVKHYKHTSENPDKNPMEIDLGVKKPIEEFITLNRVEEVTPSEKIAAPFPLNTKLCFKYPKKEKYELCTTFLQKVMYYLNMVKYMIKKNFKPIFKILFCILCTIFVVIAGVHDIDKSKVILTLYLLVLTIYFYKNIKYLYGNVIKRKAIKPISSFTDRHSTLLLIIFMAIGALLLILFVIIQMEKDKLHWISLAGFFLILLFITLTSKDIRSISVRTVGTSLVLLVLATYTMQRLKFGTSIVGYLGVFIKIINTHAKEGKNFLFGENATAPAYKIFPVLIFFSAFNNLLYYIGLMGFITVSGAYLLKKLLNITNKEALTTFGNIFLGNIESPLLIKPYLPYLSKSEYNLVIAGGFSSLAGGVLAVYVESGVSDEHLLACSIMAPLATIALCKLNFPSLNKSDEKVEVYDETIHNYEENFVHAISEGAFASITLVASIAVSLIAFVSMQALFNSAVRYLCGLVGYQAFDFTDLLSYVFYPLSFIIGIEPKDRLRVASLLGKKVFINEFIAFSELVTMTNGNLLSKRSIVLSVYMLGSFANFGTMGSTFGAMKVLVPSRSSETAKAIPRAFLPAFFVSILNATIVGFIMPNI